MTFSSTLEKTDTSDIYHWFFRIPDEVAEAMISGRDRRVICTVNESVKYHCAIHGDGTGGYIIMLNRQRCKKLGLVRGESFNVSVEKDNSEYGVPMSEELREVMDQMPYADELFHKMTKGKQRTLIYWVQNVKSSEIKIRRALVMATHLEQLDGEIDYKLLNVQIKEANQEAKRGLG